MANLTPALLVGAFRARVSRIDASLDAATTHFQTMASDMQEQFVEGLPQGDYAGKQEMAVGPLCFRLEFAEYREIPESTGRILLLRRWMSGDTDLTSLRPVVPMLQKDPCGIETTIAARLIPGFLRDLEEQVEKQTAKPAAPRSTATRRQA